MLIAVFIYALYSALFRKRPSIHPLSMLILTFGLGTLMLFPLYLWELAVVGPFSLNALAAVMSILYVALFPSVVAYFCWNRGIEMIGANRAGLFSYLVPVFASVMAILSGRDPRGISRDGDGLDYLRHGDIQPQGVKGCPYSIT
jgi:drug/metabolite transporter (DMT)-like permease